VPHGAKSEAVAELLAWALETRATSRPLSSSRVRPSKDRRECERILAFFKTFILPEATIGCSVGTPLLAKAITIARGRMIRKGGLGLKADPRTIKKWLKRLEAHGYIAQNSWGSWTILWLPDDRRCRELLGDLWHLAAETR